MAVTNFTTHRQILTGIESTLAAWPHMSDADRAAALMRLAVMAHGALASLDVIEAAAARLVQDAMPADGASAVTVH